MKKFESIFVVDSYHRGGRQPVATEASGDTNAELQIGFCLGCASSRKAKKVIKISNPEASSMEANGNLAS